MDSAAENARRLVQILKLSFITSGALFILIVYRVPSKNPVPSDPAFGLVITLIALVDIAVGFLAPKFLSKRAGNYAGASPRSTSQQQWVSRCILSLALFESCSLFAVVLHFSNASVYLVALLFTVSLLSMIVWSPGAAPASDDGAIKHYES